MKVMESFMTFERMITTIKIIFHLLHDELFFNSLLIINIFIFLAQMMLLGSKVSITCN